jgi:hypothetical protein
MQTGRLRTIHRRGRTSGAVRTVEVELEFETPSRRPPQAESHCSAADGRPDLCQASQRRSQRQPVHGFESRNIHRHENRNRSSSSLFDPGKQPSGNRCEGNNQTISTRKSPRLRKRIQKFRSSSRQNRISIIDLFRPNNPNRKYRPERGKQQQHHSTDQKDWRQRLEPSEIRINPREERPRKTRQPQEKNQPPQENPPTTSRSVHPAKSRFDLRAFSNDQRHDRIDQQSRK